MSNIFKDSLLGILDISEDDSIEITQIEIIDNIKYIHVSRRPSAHYCPVCSSKLISKGIYQRKTNHPVLQDGTTIHIIVHQRKWKCPNCNNYYNESFPFLQRYKHNSNITPILILDAMKDLNCSTAAIAKRFFVSDTYVHDIFTAYVDIPRLPLSEYISVDEVYLNISNSEKYAFVIMDFITGDIIDIVHNRWSSTLDDYFHSIPLDERKKVKAIISDAYKSYLSLPKNYFPNAKSILDSFHSVKYLISILNNYINGVYKKYKEINLRELERKNGTRNIDKKSIKDSKEMILLKNHRWVLLKNSDDIEYSPLRYDYRLGMNVDTYRIKYLFLKLDDNFEYMLKMKEEFIQFNNNKYNSLDDLLFDFTNIVSKFSASHIIQFREFANYLKEHKVEILASFTSVLASRKGSSKEYYSRLSNGPMESFNRKPKDYKRNCRGFSNFDYTRNRILWSTRTDPPFRAIPKPIEQIHSYQGKKRGNYKKYDDNINK